MVENGKHFYTVDDKPTYYPGVTGILDAIAKRALVPWASKETANYTVKIMRLVVNAKRKPDERFFETLIKRAKKQPTIIKEKAAKIGTAAHSDFDRYIVDMLAGKNPEPVQNEFSLSFHYWLKTERLRIVCGDCKVASLDHGFGGSIDVGLENEKRRFVIGDFKTGNNIYSSHAYQAGGGYSIAAKETFGLDYYPEAVIYRFLRNREAYYRAEIEDTQHCRQAFLDSMGLSCAETMIHFKKVELIKPKKKEKQKNETPC